MTKIKFEKVKLGDVVKVVQDRWPNRKEWKFDKYVAGEHIKSGEIRINDYGLIEGNEEVIGPAFHMRFKPGHVLYSTRRAYLRKGGIVNFEGICSNVTLVLQADETKFLQSLLPFVLQSENFVQFAIDHSIGSTNPFVKWKDLTQFEFLLPSLTEQRKISEFLWAVQDNLEKTEDLLMNSLKLKRGLVEKLLTKGMNHKKFKKIETVEIPEDWEYKELGDICEIIMGQSPPSSSYNSEKEGLPFIQGNADFGDKCPIISTYTTKPTKVSENGDILFTVRAPVGELNWNNSRICIGRGVAAIRPKKNVNPYFIYYNLERLNLELNRLSQGSTFTAINGKELRKFKIGLASPKEQESISKILLKIEDSISDFEQSRISTSKLKKKLTDDFISGKIHV